MAIKKEKKDWIETQCEAIETLILNVLLAGDHLIGNCCSTGYR